MSLTSRPPVSDSSGLIRLRAALDPHHIVLSISWHLCGNLFICFDLIIPSLLSFGEPKCRFRISKPSPTNTPRLTLPPPLLVLPLLRTQRWLASQIRLQLLSKDRLLENHQRRLVPNQVAMPRLPFGMFAQSRYTSTLYSVVHVYLRTTDTVLNSSFPLLFLPPFRVQLGSYLLFKDG